MTAGDAEFQLKNTTAVLDQVCKYQVDLFRDRINIFIELYDSLFPGIEKRYFLEV